MRAYEIYADRLYQGARPKRPQDVEYLRELGIGLVVNLWTRPNPALAEFEYIHQPTPDGKRFDREGLLELAEWIAAQPKRAYVHCNAGRNRSGLVCALVLRRLTGMSGAQAMVEVRRRRPRAIANPHFAAWLETLP